MATAKKVKVRFLTHVSYGYPLDHPDKPGVDETEFINGLPYTRPVPQSEQFAAGSEATLHESDVEVLNSGDRPLVEVVSSKTTTAEDAE